MKTRWRFYGLLSVFLLSATACNFHLRGFYESPLWLSPVAVDEGAVHRDLKILLENDLRAYHIAITSLEDAAHIIVLEKDTMIQKINYVSASTTPRQYTLIYTLQFSLISRKLNEPLITSRSVSVNRQLTVNNDRILGSDFETKLIYEEMHNEALMQLLNQINKVHHADRVG